MSRRRAPLSEQQLKVLSWVADGCPDGVWTGVSYKRTAYMLADRGLITVDRRRHAWSASITDRGRYYVDHGTYFPDVGTPSKVTRSRAVIRGASGRSHATVDDSGAGFQVSPADLVIELQSHDGTLTVSDPSPDVRAGYRSAINRATSAGLIPEGYVLHYQGRDRGDLRISLDARDPFPDSGEPLPPIPLPETLDPVHDAVKALRDQRTELLDVGEMSRVRALLILQAIADECHRRGYEFGLDSDGKSTFQIRTDEAVFRFTMAEEYTRREVLDPVELATVKYDWQRVRAVVQQVRADRLVIRLSERYTSVSWADRKRRNLADKLPELFAYIKQTSSDIAERRAQAERDRQERHSAWEAAIGQARQYYITDLNRARLADQLADAARAEELRRFAALIDKNVARFADADAQRAHNWATWARAEANRIDPLLHPENLTRIEPEQTRARDLDPFMPPGMTALHPPI